MSENLSVTIEEAAIYAPQEPIANPVIGGVEFSGDYAGATLPNKIYTNAAVVDFDNSARIVIEDSSANVGIKDVTVQNLSQNDHGAAILALSASSIIIENSNFLNNTAVYRGGAMYSAAQTLTISDSLFSGNQITGNYEGGAIYNAGKMSLTNTTFKGNFIAGNYGGAIYTTGADSSIADCVFDGNYTVKHSGGAIYATGKISISETVFTDNFAVYYAGAFYNTAAGSSVTDSVFSGNTAKERGGAAIYTNAALTISNTLFLNNKGLQSNADGVAGAVWVDKGAEVAISGSTFTGNSTRYANGGGALYVKNGATASVSDTAFTTESDSILVDGTLNLTGQVTLNGAVKTGNDGAVKAQDADLTFINNKVFTVNSAWEFSGSNDLTFNGTQAVTFDTLTAVDTVTIGNKLLQDIGKNYLIASGINYTTLSVAGTRVNSGEAVTINGANYTFTFDSENNTLSASRDFDDDKTISDCAIYAPAETDNIAIAGLLFTGSYAGATMPSTKITTNAAFSDITTSTRMFFNNASGVLGLKRHTTQNITSSDDGIALRIDNADKVVIRDSNFLNNVNTYRYGGAIHAANATVGALDIAGTSFSGNTANHSGGAISVLSAATKVDIADSTFSNNTAKYFGGAIYNSGALTVTDSTFTGNTAGIRNGGAIWSNGKLTVSGSKFTGNKSSFDNDGSANGGGAIYIEKANDSTISKSLFADNETVRHGGAVYAYTSVTVSGSTFSGNTGSYGGAWAQGSGTLTATDSLFNGNDAANHGGAIYSGSGAQLTVSGSTFTDNTGYHGGAILHNGAMNISNSYFFDNKLTNNTGNGGAIYTSGAETVFSGNTASGNKANHSGGVINASGNLTVSDSVFENNEATYYGGVLNVTNATSIEKSLFANNSSRDGGAINASGKLTISGSTFVANDAGVITSGSAYGGGAILLRSAEAHTITNSLFANNSSVKQAGTIYAGKGSLNVSGSTFSGNSSDGHCGNIYLNEGITFEAASTLFTGNVAGAAMPVTGNGAHGGALAIFTATATINGATFSGNTATLDGGAIYNSSNATCTISGATFTGNTAGRNGGAIYNEGVLSIRDSVFGTSSDAILTYGKTLDLSGSILLNASITTLETNPTVITVTDADFTFKNSENITISELTFADALSTMYFAGERVNFAAVGGQDLSNVEITVDDALVKSGTVIATGVAEYDKINVNLSGNLQLVHSCGALALAESVTAESNGKVIGKNGNIFSGEATGSFFASTAQQKSGDSIFSVISGTVKGTVIGGQWADGTDDYQYAAGGSVMLNFEKATIGDTSHIYGGGYMYGEGVNGSVDKAGEADMTVDRVNMTLSDTTAKGLIFGGIHARGYGYAAVDRVSITVNGGTYGRIHGGGWAEKGAYSVVDYAYINVNYGNVEYVYAGGCNATTENGYDTINGTFVGEADIVIHSAAKVRYVYLGARYAAGKIGGDVRLTVTGEVDSQAEFRRISGWGSTGMDSSFDAETQTDSGKSTVRLETDVTTAFFDYIDELTILEDCTLNVFESATFGDGRNMSVALVTDKDDSTLDWEIFSGKAASQLFDAVGSWKINGAEVILTDNSFYKADGSYTGFGLEQSENSLVIKYKEQLA